MNSDLYYISLEEAHKFFDWLHAHPDHKFWKIQYPRFETMFPRNVTQQMTFMVPMAVWGPHIHYLAECTRRHRQMAVDAADAALASAQLAQQAAKRALESFNKPDDLADMQPMPVNKADNVQRVFYTVGDQRSYEARIRTGDTLFKVGRGNKDLTSADFLGGIVYADLSKAQAAAIEATGGNYKVDAAVYLVYAVITSYSNIYQYDNDYHLICDARVYMLA